MGACMSDRKKPGVAFWATIVVVLGLVAYPLSFGPACWWFASLDGDGDAHVSAIYLPIGQLYLHSANDGWFERGIGWYATRRHEVVTVPFSFKGQRVTIYRPD